jgi:hypothetical protein
VAAPLPTPAPTAPVVDTIQTVPCEAALSTNPTPPVLAKVKMTKQPKPEVLVARKQSARVVRAVNKVFRDVGPEENAEDDAEKLSAFKLEDPSDSEQSDCDDDAEECANDPIIAEPETSATVADAPAAMAEDVTPTAETAEVTAPVAGAPSTPPKACADSNTDTAALTAVPSTPAPAEAEKAPVEAPVTPAAAPKTPSRNRTGARSKCTSPELTFRNSIPRHSGRGYTSFCRGMCYIIFVYLHPEVVQFAHLVAALPCAVGSILSCTKSTSKRSTDDASLYTAGRTYSEQNAHIMTSLHSTTGALALSHASKIAAMASARNTPAKRAAPTPSKGNTATQESEHDPFAMHMASASRVKRNPDGRPSIGTIEQQWEYMRQNFFNNDDEEITWSMVSRNKGAYKHAHAKYEKAEDRYFKSLYEIQLWEARLESITTGAAAKASTAVQELGKLCNVYQEVSPLCSLSVYTCGHCFAKVVKAQMTLQLHPYDALSTSGNCDFTLYCCRYLTVRRPTTRSTPCCPSCALCSPQAPPMARSAPSTPTTPSWTCSLRTAWWIC